MFDKELYKKEIIKKYANISLKDNTFYNTNYIKDRINPFLKISNIAAVILLLAGITTVIAYTGKIIYDNYKQTSMNRNFLEDYNYNKDMELYENSFYYKKITDYEQYTDYSKYWTNITKMTKEDFNENILLLIYTESPRSRWVKYFRCIC